MRSYWITYSPWDARTKTKAHIYIKSINEDLQMLKVQTRRHTSDRQNDTSPGSQRINKRWQNAQLIKNAAPSGCFNTHIHILTTQSYCFLLLVHESRFLSNKCSARSGIKINHTRIAKWQNKVLLSDRAFAFHTGCKGSIFGRRTRSATMLLNSWSLGQQPNTGKSNCH